MRSNAVVTHRLTPSASSASALAAWFLDECAADTPRVLTPRAEAHLVVRFGLATRPFDVYAIGTRQRAHRKLIRAGQRTLIARVRLGMHEAVLGVLPGELAGRVVALEELWGDAATRKLSDELARTRELIDAVAVVDRAIAERVAGSRAANSRLAREAARRLESANVGAVAAELGVSERNLRRVFRAAVGMSPKAFAKLTRFQRALRAAREQGHGDWARIAVQTGYYDQAHLIAEFRELTGVTPRALLRELEAGVTSAQR